MSSSKRPKSPVTPGRPIPIGARLQLSKDAVARLEAASGRDEKKAAMREIHDELAASLLPRLEHLREDGVIIDFATSWVLEEIVVHARADQIDAATTALSAFPELRDVATGGLSGRRRR